jgi:tRNA1Val (adenine37-N6)-methyltransferase
MKSVNREMTETLEQLRIGNLKFLQPKHGYRFSVDAILLADFMIVKSEERLIDLGTGSGIIPLLTSVLTPAQEIIGLEIQERLVKLARENVIINHLEDRVHIVHGDLRQVMQLFRPGEFDVLCSNPPYRKVGTGRINPDNEQAIARHEISCQLGDLLSACKYLVKPGGKAYLIYLPERLSELFAKISSYQLEPKRIRCVHSSEKSTASLVLVEAHRDASSGVSILPPLFLYNQENEYTDEARKILREG